MFSLETPESTSALLKMTQKPFTKLFRSEMSHLFGKKVQQEIFVDPAKKQFINSFLILPFTIYLILLFFR